MTKTLTEQWREGELECGYYYIKVNPKCGQDTIVSYYVDFEGYFYTRLGAWRNDVIKEVVAPVPSYQTWKEFQQYFVDSLELEVKLKKAYEELEKQSIEIVGLKTEKEQLVSKTEQLEKKLKIATKALKLYAELNIVGEEAREALKEMEGVK